jgi:hypothetical protein
LKAYTVGTMSSGGRGRSDVIPKEGVESVLKELVRDDERALVIPREGVERKSRRGGRSPLAASSPVIPREGVERSGVRFQAPIDQGECDPERGS